MILETYLYDCKSAYPGLQLPVEDLFSNIPSTTGYVRPAGAQFSERLTSALVL